MALCDFDTRTTVYKGYGNVLSVLPLANVRTNEHLDMTLATEVHVCVGGVTASSTDVPAYVSWEFTADDEWLIHFQPGMFAAVPTGEQDASIIVFGAGYANGLVLTNEYPLNIVEVC
jgi:hypothetical protein